MEHIVNYSLTNYLTSANLVKWFNVLITSSEIAFRRENPEIVELFMIMTTTLFKIKLIFGVSNSEQVVKFVYVISCLSLEKCHMFFNSVITVDTPMLSFNPRNLQTKVDINMLNINLKLNCFFGSISVKTWNYEDLRLFLSIVSVINGMC